MKELLKRNLQFLPRTIIISVLIWLLSFGSNIIVYVRAIGKECFPESFYDYTQVNVIFYYMIINIVFMNIRYMSFNHPFFVKCKKLYNAWTYPEWFAKVSIGLVILFFITIIRAAIYIYWISIFNNPCDVIQ